MYLSAAGQFHVIGEQGSYNSLNPLSKESTEIVASIFIIPSAWLKFHLSALLLKTGMLLETLPNLEVCSIKLVVKLWSVCLFLVSILLDAAST